MTRDAVRLVVFIGLLARGGWGEAPGQDGEDLAGNNASRESGDRIAKPSINAEAAPEEVMLGNSELTTGIPGKGPLSMDEIKRWLADERNHVVLKPTLPMGLAAAATQITGLEQNPLTRAKIE